MDLLIAIDDERKATGLTRYLAQFNAQRQPKPARDEDGNEIPGTPVPDLSPSEFVLLFMDRYLSGWADQYAPATVPAAVFRQRFTADERRAIRTAAVADARVGALYDRLDEVEVVHLDGDELRAGLAALEVAGLLREGRAAEISRY